MDTQHEDPGGESADTQEPDTRTEIHVAFYSPRFAAIPVLSALEEPDRGMSNRRSVSLRHKNDGEKFI